MSKKVFIIHGWGGYPSEGWFPWLKAELEKNGFLVEVPEMPNSDEPRINVWIPFLREIINNPDQDTYLVGHSIGCQAIARFIEKLPEGVKIGGAVFVAGFFKRLTNLEEEEISSGVDKEWLEAPIDFDNTKNKLIKSFAIFSSNDESVPLDNQDDFREKLGSEIIIDGDKGHFSGSDGINELHVVFDSILKMAK